MSVADAKSTQGSPFWRFSLRFYRQPRVADACIALQEESGVDVNLLLYLLWFVEMPGGSDLTGPMMDRLA